MSAVPKTNQGKAQSVVLNDLDKPCPVSVEMGVQSLNQVGCCSEIMTRAAAKWIPRWVSQVVLEAEQITDCFVVSGIELFEQLQAIGGNYQNTACHVVNLSKK